MKRALFYSLITSFLMFQSNAFATISLVKVKTNPELTTTSAAKLLNIETPFRCSVKNFGDQEISATIALKDKDFQMTFFDQMDRLPRYEVNGFSFNHLPVDEAIQRLVDEAGITVYTEDGVYPSLTGQDVYGELSDVVSELARSGSIFYRYDADRKELYLSRKGRFELHLPNNRMVMLAMLDALRGAGIDNVTPDWKNNSLMMTLNQSSKKTVQELINYIVNDSYLLLADTRVFQLSPKTNEATWQNTVEQYGKGRVYSAKNGIIGKVLTTGHHKKSENLLTKLSQTFNIAPISQGVAIVPNGWKMRFDVGQCSAHPDLNPLSVLLSTQIRSPEKVETHVTLDTHAGEISTFEAVSAIDNELVILGIPTLNTADSQDNELLVTLKLRLIRFIKDKE